MMYSTLLVCPIDPPEGCVVVGAGPGGSIVHAPAGMALPDDAILLIGPEPWTWNDFADRYPEYCSAVTPQEYAGEPTGRGIDVARFPRLAPALEEGV